MRGSGAMVVRGPRFGLAAGAATGGSGAGRAAAAAFLAVDPPFEAALSLGWPALVAAAVFPCCVHDDHLLAVLSFP
jgi:hypothetical protein